VRWRDSPPTPDVAGRKPDVGGGKRTARPGHRLGRDDRGSASIFVLAVALLVLAAGLGAAAVGTARVGRHQARTAADLGALAGAMRAIYGESDACAQARRTIARNGGEMASCTVSGLEIVVTAQVEVGPLPGMVRHASAAARAGPVYTVDE
jgi:secretion/DNA translocation related TadE-like protein